jgi:hypothetical protein
VLTVIVFVVAVVLHFTLPEQPVAVNVAVSALHRLFLFVLITGASGLLPVVIVITLLLALSPQSVIHNAE